MRRIDPLIAGGGPAGAAAAITLAQAGARPVVLERQRETGDALCGGFLSWRTLQTLETLGIERIDGHRIDRLRLFAGNSFGEALLPHPAMGVSRHRLDSRLLARAESLGAGIERGVTVREWSDGQIETGDGATLTPETLFLATGKYEPLVSARDENIKAFFWKGSDYIVYWGDIGGDESGAFRSIPIYPPKDGGKRRVVSLSEAYVERHNENANFMGIVDRLPLDPYRILAFGRTEKGSWNTGLFYLDVRTGRIAIVMPFGKLNRR